MYAISQFVELCNNTEVIVLLFLLKQTKKLEMHTMLIEFPETFVCFEIPQIINNRNRLQRGIIFSEKWNAI